MSSDLFAAFGDPVPEPLQTKSQNPPEEDPWKFDDGKAQTWQAGPVNSVLETDQHENANPDVEDENDDFGDFEDASAPAAAVVKHTTPTESNPWSPGPESPARSQPVTRSESPSKPAPPKKTSLPSSPKPQAHERPSKIGKHPFADHMDFLFSGGDDEYDAGEDELNDLATNPEAAMAYSKRIIAEQEARSNGVPGNRAYSKPTKPLPFKLKNEAVPPKKTTPQPQPPRPPNKLRKKSGYAPAKDPNVLFDAEDVSSQDEDDDDDEFGDFEAGVADVPQPAAASSMKAPAPSAQMPRIDLLDLDDSFSNDTAMDGMASPGRQRPASVLGPPVDSRASKLVSPTTPTTAPAEDTWEDFETAEPTYPSPPTNSAPHHPPSSHPPHPPPPPPPSRPLPKTPPTTIPPPSTLLSLLPSLLTTLQTTLLTPLSHLPTSRSTLLTHPSTLSFLHTHLSHLLAIAHILAGRKHRWKRDVLLSQSHRLGSAGGKGMKLAGVDRSLLLREDREVLDAVQSYRPIASKLRAAVAVIFKQNKAGAEGLVVPDLAETMPVRAVGVNEGGLRGVRACALCGLKREERVAKCHDHGVEDSFGEWWVEGAEMHVCCARFWVDVAEEKLRGR